MRFTPLLFACAFAIGKSSAYDSVVVFNEVHYHPAAGQQEFIELRNLNGVDINLGGWRVSGGANYDFPEGTTIPGHGYLLLGSVPGALGAFIGNLNNGGETLRLRNRNGRIMDELNYDDSNGWPEGADGSGFTLARREADAAAKPEAWAVSEQPGGTPGEANFNPGVSVERTLIPHRAEWNYADGNAAPPAAWMSPGFDDGSWASSNAAFGSGTSFAPSLTVASDLVERFRASSIQGVADGAVLSTWEDEAVGDGVVQQAVAGTSNPTLRLNATPAGKATVRFDGNDEMRTSLAPGIDPTGGFCYWIVLKANAAPVSGLVTNSTGTYLFDRNTNLGGLGLFSLKAVGGFYGLQKRYDSNTGIGGPVSTTPISQTAFQIVTVRRNRSAGRFEMWVDGRMQGVENDTGAALTPGPLNMGRYSTGTTQGFNGEVAEFLIYRNELTTADFQSVGAYLEAEYGLDTAFPGIAIKTPLSATAPTTYFRKQFNYAGAAERSSLRLETTVADGAVFYLNGTEIHRVNLPGGPISHTTPALTDIPVPAPSNFAAFRATPLVTGSNVLTVSLHHAAGSTDTYFEASLQATEGPENPGLAQRLEFHEITGAGDPAFFVEVRNDSPGSLNTAGWTIRDANGRSAAFPPQLLRPGALLVMDAAALGFSPLDGTKLFLLAPGGTRLTDARAVTARLRGLTEEGTWGHPLNPTPGASNPVPVNRDIVINEIFYHALNDGPEQWIELHNKGQDPVDLSGWKLSDAVTWQFAAGTSIPAGGYLVVAWNPTAFSTLHPGVTSQGPWSGNLSGKGEVITLRDREDNRVDQVGYADGGRWSPWADGGGSSLELKDPRADNRNPAAWDSSDESLSAPWQTFTYTGTGAHATTSSLTYYHEFLMGLLDAGEMLIDDISVKEVTVGNRELIQNGSFTDGTARAWRNIGTHRPSTVVDDPFSPGNPVLKLSATGGTEHMNNNCGTTLKAGTAYVALNTASTYTITFRAKWLRGSHRLHTRLYFNRLSRQSLLPLPLTGGTPGAVNSRYVPNAGPTLEPGTVSPVLPAAGVPATVHLTAEDPDGIATMELFASLNGAAFTSIPMTGTGGRYSAVVPGQANGAMVQFYVRATDGPGAISYWPAAGPESRAMIPWQDGRSQLVMPSGARPHNVRVVLPGADANFLYREENVQSNEYRPCTVILDETRAWYEAATRLKSSEHGRFQQNRVGFNLKFGNDDPFLGAHETISIDRSGNKTTEGLDGSTITSQREILLKSVMNAAGGIYSMEDDLIRVIPPVATGSPTPAFTGALALGEAILSKSRFDDEYLEGQWENGGKGPMFKQEYIYPLTQTINPVTRAKSTIGAGGNLNASAEQPKISQTGGDPGPGGIAVRSYNPPPNTDPKENYRWHWLIRNARGDDDYSGMIAALTAVGQTQGSAAFKTQTTAALEVDTWMRAVVPAQLFGVVDNYLASTGSTHNFLLYFPPGGKGVAIPWDLDFLGQAAGSSSAGITNGGDITKFIADAANRRRYYGHVLDVLDRSFNDAFLTRWATHYSTFGVDDMSSSLSFLRARATYVRNLVTGQGGQTAPIPAVAFTRTSPATLDVVTPFATILGDGWIDIDSIRLTGSPEPLAVSWTDQNSWSLQLPLKVGTHLYTLEAVRPNGSVAGTVTVTVTSTSGIVPAAADNVVVSKLHYHPAAPTPQEAAAGFSSEDDFEYLELQNISPHTVDLSNCQFDAGLTYAFAPNTRITAGGRLVLPRRQAAFALRHPGVTTVGEYLLAADPTANRLSNGGEQIALRSASGLDIKRFSYRDELPWPATADGGGPCLVLISPMANPAHPDPLNWRAGSVAGGTPGTADGIPFTGNANEDLNLNGRADLIDFAVGGGDQPSATLEATTSPPSFLFTVERDSAAQVSLTIESSTDPSHVLPGGWAPASGVSLLSRTSLPGTLERLVFHVTAAPGAIKAFVRARFSTP